MALGGLKTVPVMEVGGGKEQGRERDGGEGRAQSARAAPMRQD